MAVASCGPPRGRGSSPAPLLPPTQLNFCVRVSAGKVGVSGTLETRLSSEAAGPSADSDCGILL